MELKMASATLTWMQFRMSARLCLIVLLSATACAARAETPPPRLPAGLAAAQEPPKVVPRVLEAATPENTRLVVSLGRQRAVLMVGEEVAIDTPVSSGKKRGATPVGEFLIAEKQVESSSARNGDFVDKDGQAVCTGVSTRIDAAPSGTVFRMVPVRYHLRLDNGGPSIHAGRLPGYPASDTSVRLPVDIAPLIFQRVKQGTPVRIEE